MTRGVGPEPCEIDRLLCVGGKLGNVLFGEWPQKNRLGRTEWWGAEIFRISVGGKWRTADEEKRHAGPECGIVRISDRNEQELTGPRLPQQPVGLVDSLWVPRTLSPHATCTYSWMRPPSRSRRSGRMAAPEGGGVPPAGGR